MEKAVIFTSKQAVALQESTRPSEDLQNDEIEGRTLVSLVSAGSEVEGILRGNHYKMQNFPRQTGYAAVFCIEKIGADVKDLAVGDRVFAKAPHRSWQRLKAENAVKISDDLSSETAVFARMLKVSMPAFARSLIRPPEKAVITGLGVVGLLAAQLAQVYGFETYGCDPQATRREIAAKHGIQSWEKIPLNDEKFKKKIGLGIECSGHEQATLDLCNILKIYGELSLVGVPWIAKTDLKAQVLLHAIFYNYLTVKTGWEGCMPANPEIHSERHHFSSALDWLASGKIKVNSSVYKLVLPQECALQYEKILNNKMETLTVMFDWRSGTDKA